MSKQQGPRVDLCYIREKLYDGVQQMQWKWLKKKVEDRLWLRFDSKFFGFPKDLFLCLLYITPEFSTRVFASKYMGHLKRWNYCALWQRKYFIGRRFQCKSRLTSRLCRFTFIPLPPEYIPDHFYARNSLDSVISNYGRELIDMCIASTSTYCKWESGLW